MDLILQENRVRWNALASANVLYSRPFLDYTREKAEQYLYENQVLTNVEDQHVLLLAGGGGQESVPFSLLGAQVTVYDLSEIQYRHCLSTLLNTLARHTFTLLRFTEWIVAEENTAPNSWPYFTQALAPMLNTFWRLDKA